MTKYVSSWAIFHYRYRFLALALGLLLTVFFGYHALLLKFNFTPDNIHLKNDPAYQFYEETYLPAFMSKGTPCLIGLSGDFKHKSIFEALFELESLLKKNSFVTSVFSLKDVDLLDPYNKYAPPKPVISSNYELSETHKNLLRMNPLVSNFLISKNDDMLGLALKIPTTPGDLVAQNKAIQSIKTDIKSISQNYPDVNFYFAGLPVIQTAMIELLKQDQIRFVPVVVLLLIILLWLITRRFMGVFFPLFAIFCAITWSLGYLSLNNHPINIVNNAIVILIMVIGVADAVHIYARFQDEANLERMRAKKLGVHPSKERMMALTIQGMFWPCFFTSATTAIGFASAISAHVEIIKEFGLDAAFGVMGAFVVTMLLMPALLSLHPLTKGHKPKPSPIFLLKLPLKPLLEKITRFSIRYARPLVLSSVVVFFLSLWLCFGIKPNQTWVGELPAHNAALSDLMVIEKSLTGMMPFEVVFSGQKNQLESVSTLRYMDSLVQTLRSNPIKPQVRALSDVVQQIDAHLNPAHFGMPLKDFSDEQIVQALTTLNALNHKNKDDLVGEFWSKNQNMLRIQGFLKNAATDAVEAFHQDVKSLIQKNPLQDVRIQLTGTAIISADAMHFMISDMASSLLLAIVCITLFVALLFRSFKLTLITIFPNLLPITLTITAMNLFHIDVRIATVLIFSMAIGISVDSCIHQLSRLKEEAQSAKKSSRLGLIRLIHRAIIGTGRPIIFTTFILLLGFSIMAFSQFRALRDFSILSAITLLSAMVVDLILMPALIFLAKPLQHKKAHT